VIAHPSEGGGFARRVIAGVPVAPARRHAPPPVSGRRPPRSARASAITRVAEHRRYGMFPFELAQDHVHPSDPTVISTDNQGAVALAK